MVSGFVVVISAPSGTGKTTIVRALLERNERLQFAISHTTRPPRPGEKHGQDYYFVDSATFTTMVDRGAFIEWASVHGHRYGTSRQEIQRILAQGKIPLLDIDVQGAFQLQRRWPQGIFIMLIPPSWEVLEERLRRRGDLSEVAIQQRLERAREELAWWWLYDYVVINDVLEDTVETIVAILWSYTHSQDFLTSMGPISGQPLLGPLLEGG